MDSKMHQALYFFIIFIFVAISEKVNAEEFPKRKECSDSEKYIYDSVVNKCVAKVGTNCSAPFGLAEQPCIKNAYCDYSEEKDYSLCTCKPGFIATRDNLCGVDFDGPCGITKDESSTCSHKFRCTTEYKTDVTTAGFYYQTQSEKLVFHSTCQCPNPKYQDYDPVDHVCRGHVGAPCAGAGADEEESECVRQAFCKDNEANGRQCECKEGHVSTDNGYCEIDFGFSCNHTDGDVSQIPPSETCDKKSNLLCIDGKCSCKNEADIFDQKRRKCLTRVGLNCIDNSECVTHAICLSTKETSIWGKCSCKDGFKVTKEFTCV